MALGAKSSKVASQRSGAGSGRDAAAMRERARRFLPNGSNGEFDLPADIMPVVARGEQALLWDVDGRRFIDCSLAFGAVLLGHAEPTVTEAVARALRDGENFGAVAAVQVELAERFCTMVPCAEQVRFCTSGTEAMTYCIRIARAATRRPLVVKFEGAYHGSTDIGCASLAATDGTLLPRPGRLDRGGSPFLEQELLVAPFNDEDFIAELMASRGGEVAAILVEPLHRCIPPAQGFLARVRQLADEHGALLVFDEVVTGFRLAPGGAQQAFGVIPDIAGFGKALGNGYPIGAVAGRAELVDLMSETRLGADDYVWSVSTGGGSTICAAAALAALDHYERPGFHRDLDALAAYMRARLGATFRGHGVTANVLGFGALMQVVLTDRPIRNSGDMRHPLQPLEHTVMVEAFRRGVFVNPLGTKIYLSAAHTQAQCDEVAEIVGAAIMHVLEDQ